jgi:Protein of unknown function (DUF2612)
MASEPIDRIAQGLSRIAQMYSASAKFIAFLEALLALQQDSEDALQEMALQTSIDEAQGVNLWTIATIVGAPIVYTDELLSTFIGFVDQEGGLPFSDATDPSIEGGQWREDGEAEVMLEDLWAAQRLVIRCEIARNQSNGSGDSVQRAMMFLFPNINCVIFDNQDMSFSIGIGRLLSPIEKQLLLNYDILPRPVGVKLDQITAFDSPFFGFEDTPQAATFDIGHWANLEYDTARAERSLNFVLVPTKR